MFLPWFREASLAWSVRALFATVCEAEMIAQHNFELLAQKLNDEVADQNKQLKATKKAKAEAEEAKSIAEGDLSSTQKGLKEDEASLHDLQLTPTPVQRAQPPELSTTAPSAQSRHTVWLDARRHLPALEPRKVKHAVCSALVSLDGGAGVTDGGV